MQQVQLFIATYNRPLLVKKAIQSALNQDFNSFEIFISDNSTNDDTEILVAGIENDRLIYKRRRPSLPVIDHLNAILQDVAAEYFMIFHDDDIMHTNMLSTLYNKIIENENVVAVGANAKILKNGRPQKSRFYNKLCSDHTIVEPEQMMFAYLKSSFVPFSSYLYRNKVARQLKFNQEHGGKHCDAAFVVDMVSFGSVIFLSSPLMDYNKHEDQDSGFYNFKDFSKLINYFSTKFNYNRHHPIIKRFRIQNIYAELKYNIFVKSLPVSSKKYHNLITILFKNSTFEYFPKIILITILGFTFRVLKISK